MIDIDAINRNQGFAQPSDPQYAAVSWFHDLLACRACTAREEARRVVPGAGPLTAEIAIVGQNPGEEEDQSGAPFTGRAGEELNIWLRLLGLQRERVLVTNLVKCHTVKNRAPRPKEKDTCERLWLAREFETFAQVRAVIPLGRPALQGLVGKLGSLPEVLEPWWMKAALGGRELHVIPLAHPAYLLRTPANRALMYEKVLPIVRDYFRSELPDVYQRAAV